MKKQSILLTISLLTLSVAMSYGANNASDSASNYSSFGGSTPNNGTGFGAWSFEGGGGEYIGGTGLGANTFGVYSGDDSNFATAIRQFTGGALVAGQTFSLNLGSTPIDSGGAVGINFLSGGSTVFTLQASGSGDWQLNDGGSNFNTTIPFVAGTSNSFAPVSFSFTLDGGNDYTVSMTEGSTTYSSGPIDAVNSITDITGVKLFSAFQGGNQNAGFDNLAITTAIVAAPEPSTWAMLGLSIPALIFLARRRKA